MSAADATQKAAASAPVRALHQVSPGEFDADVRPGPDEGREPNAQHCPVMLGCAAAWTRLHQRINAASPHDLHAHEPRAGTPYAEALRAGRSTGQQRARSEQAGTMCVESMLFAHPDDRLRAPTNTAYDDRVGLEPQTANGTRLTIMEPVEWASNPTATAARGAR